MVTADLTGNFIPVVTTFVLREDAKGSVTARAGDGERPLNPFLHLPLITVLGEGFEGVGGVVGLDGHVIRLLPVLVVDLSS